MKKIVLAIKKFKTTYFYEPLAEIILIFINNAKTRKELNIGVTMGHMLDAHCISEGIYLFGKL